MKTASNLCLGLFIAWVLLVIVDLWFNVISAATFYKLTVTLGLLCVIALVVALARRHP